MPYSYEWLVPDVLLKLNLEGRITTEEVQELSRFFLTIFDASDHLIYTMLDAGQVQSLPPFQPKNFPLMQRVMDHPMNGFCAAVNLAPISAFWLKMLGRVFNMKYTVFPTPSEGESFLRDMIRIAATEY